jgi:hypothetical protein
MGARGIIVTHSKGAAKARQAWNCGRPDAGGHQSPMLRSGGLCRADPPRSLPPGMAVPEHTQDFHAKMLVTAGEFTLTKDRIATTCRPGDMLSVPLGHP